jgi:hypothetical protein
VTAAQARVLRAAADLLDEIPDLPRLYIIISSDIEIQVPADAGDAAARLAILDQIAAPIGATEDTRHVHESEDGSAHHVADGTWQGIRVHAYAPVRGDERGTP